MQRKSSAQRTRAIRLSGRSGIFAALLVAVVGIGVFAFIRSGDAPTLPHVHGMVVNPADGLVYIGTHEGMFRVEANQRRIKRVGDERYDLMSLTVAGPGRFLASGHPAQVTRELPANLGLIESRDAGKTWQIVALGGQADLHAMRAVEGRLYAYANGTIAMSMDQGQQWVPIASGDLADFVVTKAPNVLATTRGGLMRSPATPGTRLAPQAGPPLLWLSIAPDDSIWGVTSAGEVFRSTDEGAQWERRGKVGGQAGAMLATADALYVALADGALMRSSDGGATWARIGA